MGHAYRVLTGPTAAGKTACLLGRASTRPLAVISADSRQIYRGMDIGTGKPSSGDLQILPHYLLDFLPPPITFSVYQFIIESARVFNLLTETDTEVWVCGGTGLYIRAMLDSLPLRAGPRPRLREMLTQAISTSSAEDVATRLGLVMYEPSNPARVVRACEAACVDINSVERFYLPLGLTYEDWTKDELAQPPAEAYDAALASLRKWKCLGIAVLDPGVAVLRQQIDQRVRGMFAAGLMREVEALTDAGWSSALVVREGIAYREALAALRGEISEEQAITQAVIRTQQYAKRQRTYFRGMGWPVYTVCSACLAAFDPD